MLTGKDCAKDLGWTMLWLGKESRGDDMPMSVVGDVSTGQRASVAWTKALF